MLIFTFLHQNLLNILFFQSLSTGFSFSRDFNFQIPGLTNGPSFGGSVNANAGQPNAISSALSGAINGTFSNIRKSSEQFLQQSLLQVTKPLRERLGISDNDVKSFVSNLPNLQNVLSNFKLPQVPSLPNLGNLPQLPQIGQLPNLGNGLSQLNNAFQAPQNILKNIPGVPQGLPQIPGIPDLSKIANAFNPENLKNFLPNFDLFNGNLSNDAIQQALNNFNQLTKAAGDQAKGVVQQLTQTFNQTTSVYKNSINNAADAAKKDIQNSLNGFNSTVRNCIAKNGNPGTKAIDTARQSATKCIDDKIQQAFGIVSKAKQDIDLAVGGVQNLTQGLSKCQLNVTLTVTNLPVVSASRASCLASVSFVYLYNIHITYTSFISDIYSLIYIYLYFGYF